MNNIFSFDGTSTRSTYWGTVLANFLGTVILALILGAIFPASLASVVLLAVFVASGWISLANTAKRCRDAGITPWWALATFVPFVNLVVVLVVGCLATTTTE